MNINLQSLHYESRILLTNLQLTVHKGERILIVGATGVGKSSLMGTLNLMNQHYEGSITFKGMDIRSYKPELLRSQICMVMQEPFLEDGTVQEVLDSPLRYASLKHRNMVNRQKTITDLMEAFRLPIGYLQQAASQLSGGEKQRIALIRVLQLQPEILLLDEISSALDQSTSGIISDIIFGSFAGIVIAISHDPLWQKSWQRTWLLEGQQVIDSAKGGK